MDDIPLDSDFEVSGTGTPGEFFTPGETAYRSNLRKQPADTVLPNSILKDNVNKGLMDLLKERHEHAGGPTPATVLTSPLFITLAHKVFEKETRKMSILTLSERWDLDHAKEVPGLVELLISRFKYSLKCRIVPPLIEVWAQ